MTEYSSKRFKIATSSIWVMIDRGVTCDFMSLTVFQLYQDEESDNERLCAG